MKYKKIKNLKKKYIVEDLWKEYEETRSIENRNLLIEHYLYLLYKPVKSIYPICRNTNEAEDIFQSAVIGLTEAVELYSRDKNASFQTFSRWRIHGSIIDYLRKSSLIAVPYKVRKKIKKINEEREKYDCEYATPYQINSLDAIEGAFKGGGGFIANLQTDIDELTENIVEDKIMLENIYKALEKLPFDEYVTVIQYYLYGRTLEEIARKLKMTRSGVWHIRNRAVKNIKTLMSIV